MPQLPAGRSIVLMPILISIAALIFATILGVAIFVRLRPVDAVILTGRIVLRAIGLRKKRLGEMTYFVGGSGPPLLLVHGVNDQAGGWARPALELRRHFRLIVPDLPGHGQSGPADGPLPLEIMVEALHRLVAKEANGGPLPVIGNSLGALIATLFAFRHPEDVSALVLETGGLLRFDTSQLNLAPSTREEARRITKQVWGPDMPVIADYVLDEMVRRAPSAPVLRVNAADPEKHFIEEAQLRDIEVPTTVIWGEADGILPTSYAETMASAIPDARLHVIERCGHCPHREKPAQFVKIVKEALLPEPSTLNRPSTSTYASR